MSPTSFFKKVGRGLQRGAGEFTNAVGKGAGSVLGGAAMKYALQAAPMMVMRTGGHIPGKRNKAVPIIAHGSEYVLPDLRPLVVRTRTLNPRISPPTFPPVRRYKKTCNPKNNLAMNFIYLSR